MGRQLSPRYSILQYWSAEALFWQLSIDHNVDVQNQVAGSHTSKKL